MSLPLIMPEGVALVSLLSWLAVPYLDPPCPSLVLPLFVLIRANKRHVSINPVAYVGDTHTESVEALLMRFMSFSFVHHH